MRPTTQVLIKGATLTVLKLNDAMLPGTPTPAASTGKPNRVLMVEPSTVTWTWAALGIAGLKKSQAQVPSLEGTMVAGSRCPANEA